MNTGDLEGEEKDDMECVKEDSIFYFVIQGKSPPLPDLTPPAGFPQRIHHVNYHGERQRL